MVNVHVERQTNRFGLLIGGVCMLAILVLAGCAHEGNNATDGNGFVQHDNMDDLMQKDDMMNGDEMGGMMEDGMMDKSGMSGDDTMKGGDMMDDKDMMDGEMEMVTFDLTGKNFGFMMNGQENPTLRVKKGQKVKIMFASESGFHDWVVDEFDAKTERVRDGESTMVEFVADDAGTFEYYCSVGQHRANGMEGTLIVE